MEENLRGEKTIATSISLEILTAKSKLPPIPANGSKLLSIAQQSMDKIDTSSFAKLVEIDPGLLTRVLQLANSPYYSAVDEIINLRAAITRIGLEETINSVCLYFFQKMLPQFPSITGFTSREYWAYSWACAMANRSLGHPNFGMKVIPGELYIAGLLHGIGKLLMAIHYPDEFSKCVNRAREFKQPLYRIEQDEFGTTDAFVASKILEAWNFPANICAAVGFYPMPESAPEEYREIAGVTQMAYGIAGLSGSGSSGDGVLMDLPSIYICQQPGLPISKEKIREKLIHEITESLLEKSETVVGARTGSQTKGDDITEKQSRKIPTTSKQEKTTKQRETPKKGWFARIKSLFSRH